LSLDKNILLDLLKKDELLFDETAIWDFLIEWGVRQTPELGKENGDRENWTKKNYEELKNTLSDLIPLVKFLDIPSGDFYDKIRPYEQIIPNDIYEKVMKYYLVEEPKLLNGIIKSEIIKQKHANIITNWIEKKDAMFVRTKKDSRYKFKLIYRGSGNQINNTSFRGKCMGKIASLVLVKVKYSPKIFGGYSPIGLNFNPIAIDNQKTYYHYTKDSFIFSFEGIQDMKISWVTNYDRAILEYYSTNGFNFGQSALCMQGQNLYVNNNSRNYENNLKTSSVFIIEKIETFIVVKK